MSVTMETASLRGSAGARATPPHEHKAPLRPTKLENWPVRIAVLATEPSGKKRGGSAKEQRMPTTAMFCCAAAKHGLTAHHFAPSAMRRDGYTARKNARLRQLPVQAK
jgi:hypothetical protein